jgi:hypothetical protein
MNAEFTNALRAAMNLQRAMLDMSSLGAGSSQLNAMVTLNQMRLDHAAIGAFLDAVERRLNG